MYTNTSNLKKLHLYYIYIPYRRTHQKSILIYTCINILEKYIHITHTAYRLMLIRELHIYTHIHMYIGELHAYTPYIRICMCVCIYVYMFVYVHACMYQCMQICIYIRIYACMYVCLYICMHVCINVCIYVCVCIGVYIYDHSTLAVHINQEQL